MPANAVVRARIDERTKNEATKVLAAMGLTASDAFRMMMKLIAANRELPFSPLVPNAETIAAMEEAERGEGRSFATIEELMADLHADD